MNIKYFLTITILLLLIYGNLCSQLGAYSYTSISNYPTDKISIVSDLCFIDVNTGYISASFSYSNGYGTGYIYKTTNRGINWVKQIPFNFPQNSSRIAISFANANTGYFFVRSISGMFKTTNGGSNFEQIDIDDLPDPVQDQILSTNSNGDVFVIRRDKNHICKFPHPIQYTYTPHYFPLDIKLQHIEISKTNNIIYVCGSKAPEYFPFFAKSTDGGVTYNIILNFDGNQNTAGIGSFFHMNIINNNGVDVIKISGANKLIEYNTGINSITELTSTWEERRKICFSDASNGFYMNYDFNSNVNPGVYRTTNNGQSWWPDFLTTTGWLSYPNRFYSYGNIVYFVQTDDNYQRGNFYSRLLNKPLVTYNDKTSGSGSFKINNQSYSTPNTYNVKGGSLPLWTEPILTQGNEKMFYKWSFHKMNNSIPSYDLLYDGELATYYKTKLKADSEYAIYNSNQTKAIRDTNGTLHQIHESIGGIFYSRSTNNGETFQNEEVVNSGAKWNADFPNDVSSSENRNPSLCEIRNLLNGKSFAIEYPNLSIAAAWQHYNPNGEMDIRAAVRFDNGSVTDWYKCGLPGNMNGKFKTFSTNNDPSFQSKPTIFASTRTDISNQFSSEPYDHFILVPHLEPSSHGGRKIVVTAKYENYAIYPSNGNPLTPNDFIIADGNSNSIITDYSVTAMPTYYNSIYNGYELHFAFLRGNDIVYKKVQICLGTVGGTNHICRNPYFDETETIVSELDNQLNRYTPDITIRNGKPAITYRGYKKEYRLVQIENGTDEPQTFVTHHFPVIVRCNIGTGWETALHYDGLTQQENPNIEGSKNADAYLLNFRKNNANYQYVKIGNISGYKCSPNVSEGIDAKLVKNCYLGQTGSGAGPLLIKLSFPSEEGLSSLGKQPFSIVPAGIETDGFSNLDCVIEKDSTLYSLTLGPIIASNTTYGFDDANPPQTVHNPIEFSETMVSAVFSLSNYDTLILGAHGKYATSFGQSMQPLKYHVNLVNSTTNQIHRELFSDTIKVEDSVGLEFLRGFIINNISNGTEQFYVQMIVDTVDAGDGDFNMAGVYFDNTPPEGDAPKNYKTKIFFENSSNSLTSGNHLPKEYALSQNYPNPFNPATKIRFALPKQGFVTLKIYDITGREIQTLVNDVKQAGYYSVDFNGSSLSSGVYFYRIQSGDFVQTKRMLMIK